MAPPAGGAAGPRETGATGEYSLVLQTSFLGDVVLTTPLIAWLARRGPVDVVVTPAAAALLANNPDVRRLLTYDKRGADRGVAGLRALARRLREARRDAGLGATAPASAYHAQGSVRSGMLARLAGFRRRVGFDTSAGRALYTERIPYARHAHHAERLWHLASGGAAPADPAVLRPRLHPGDAERAAVDALLAESGNAGGPWVALAPGSVWATKRWPHYAALAMALAERARVVVVGSAADTPLAREIVDAVGPAALDATGQLSLLASAELIGRCRAIVTNDSAPQHLASAMGTPTVAIFGPTVPAFGFGPLSPRAATPGLDALPCRPCHPHGPAACPLGHWRCMRDLHVRTVVASLDRIASLS
jgi:heptosyltransferase-2